MLTIIISQLLVATSMVLPVLAVGGVFLAYKCTACLPCLCLAGPKIRFFNLSLPQHSSPHGAPSISRLRDCALAGLLLAAPPPAPCLPPPTLVTEVPLGAGGRATMAAPPLHPKRVASGRPARRGCSTRTSPAQSSPSAGAARRVAGGQPARRRCSTDLTSAGAAQRVAGE